MSVKITPSKDVKFPPRATQDEHSSAWLETSLIEGRTRDRQN